MLSWYRIALLPLAGQAAAGAHDPVTRTRPDPGSAAGDARTWRRTMPAARALRPGRETAGTAGPEESEIPAAISVTHLA
jgi:hypothetical protein